MKTLFILGAGASKPYGFPLGSELREWAIRNVETVFLSNTYLKGLWTSTNTLKAFSIGFEKSNTNSIDLYLSRNTEFELIGKAVIVHKIIECEKRGFSYIEEKGDDWYFYFYNRITEGIEDKTKLSGIFDDYMFVTFNYDRSFEAYMAESIFYSFFSKDPIHDEVDFTLIPQIDIIHAYGSIGTYPEKPYSSNVSYIPQVDEKGINSLRTLYSERGVNKEINDKIKCADRIFFLGFGYLLENMEKLGIEKSILSNKCIYGTAYGNLDAEIRKIERYFEGSKEYHIEKVKTLELLKTYL